MPEQNREIYNFVFTTVTDYFVQFVIKGHSIRDINKNIISELESGNN